ncbi:hypothetical protein DWX10_22770 [Clostridium sp. AF18-27]|uniref:hypothetical protein n=1 Tax=Enterocloster TaxID=2719313 RepID=UPI000D1BA8C1|nr:MULTISPECIES: hypothetical protein [Enterocloster]MCB6343443.1 hypothetical protein [Enterocloster lavalensis]MDR3757287.1 hypothetical protein [Enterocloster sp.]PST31276.1 hypothetical protein C7256_21025 [Enterocloster lavalensis]RHR48772.1 hypothetical protein DWX10_22770 [Clostridium sp. AF18-27]
MRVDRRSRRRKSQTKGYLLSAAALLLLVGVFAVGALSFAGKAGQKGEESLRRAVTRASVQCYAIEGRYPPSVEYLEENYGVRIDRDRYNVFYNGFASNVMPEIVINPIEEEEARR